MSILEYNASLHEETLKKEGYEDGRTQGRTEGRAEGRTEERAVIIQNALLKGHIGKSSNAVNFGNPRDVP